MREAVGVALVLAALCPLTLRTTAERWLDRWHRRRTGRSATNRSRHRFVRALDAAAIAVAVLGAIVIATGH